jgi:hypothetical protein
MRKESQALLRYKRIAADWQRLSEADKAGVPGNMAKARVKKVWDTLSAGERTEVPLKLHPTELLKGLH